MDIITKSRRRLISKIVADLGKTIFAIGLASAFFEKFNAWMKITLWATCVICLVGSVLIEPKDGG